jgi:hypothetical protein
VEISASEILELYRKAQWKAFDRVLNWLNTQDDIFIDKTDLYKEVMKMKPDETFDFKGVTLSIFDDEK